MQSHSTILILPIGNSKGKLVQSRLFNQEVRNILFVLSAAIACAGLLTAFLIYYYGPSTGYLAGHVLLDPKVIEQINEQAESKKRGSSSFTFSRPEFSYFDEKAGKMQRHPVSMSGYRELYAWLAADQSLDAVPSSIEDLFLQAKPVLLTTFLRPTEGGKLDANQQSFQIVQFVPQNYYRVRLMENQEQEWAYFYHPQLYQDAMHLFTPSPAL